MVWIPTWKRKLQRQLSDLRYWMLMCLNICAFQRIALSLGPAWQSFGKRKGDIVPIRLNSEENKTNLSLHWKRWARRNIQKRMSPTNWFGSVVRVSTQGLKGPGLNSDQGHIPRLLAPSLVSFQGHVWESTHWCVSQSCFSLPLLPFLLKISGERIPSGED